MCTEVFRNVFGETMEIFVRPSDSAQNYTLKTKYVTKDCPYCNFYIPKEGSISLVELGQKNATSKWTPPKTENIEGVCVWGKYPKILDERPCGSRRCDLLGKRPSSGESCSRI